MRASALFGSAGPIVGQYINMTGALNYFTDGAAEYLRVGFLKAYTSAYAAFAARCPFACTVDLPAIKSFNATMSATNYVIEAVGWAGSNYVVYRGGSATGDAARNSADLTTWNTTSGAPGTVTGIRTACWMGGSVNRVLRASVDPTNVIIYTMSPAGSFTAATGGPAAGTSAAASLASNYAGTLAVLLNQSGGTLAQTAGHIFTSTNGTAWTSRTPVLPGGTSITNIEGVHWSRCANAFLFFGSGSVNTRVLTSTDGYTLTASYSAPVADGAFSGIGANFPPEAVAASSATVTLLSLGSGKILRTTDGTNWTIVNLNSQIGAGYLTYANVTISYDETNGFFIASMGGTAQPSMKSTDGITWTPMFQVMNTYRKVFNANGKSLLIASDGSGVYDCAAEIAQATPDWIGASGATVASGEYAYVRIA